MAAVSATTRCWPVNSCIGSDRMRLTARRAILPCALAAATLLVAGSAVGASAAAQAGGTGGIRGRLVLSRTPPSNERRPPGTESIVLVEDEDHVRAIASRMLAHLGYAVYFFADGPSAIAAILQMAEVPALLITDVVMPGMNGQVLAERLLELRPSMKVLFTSGYTANVIVHHGVLREGIEFLAKPYSLDQLAQRVREVLDK